VETVRRYHEKEREAVRWEKLRYHEQMVRAHTATLEAIVARHRTEVARCEALLGIDSEAQKGAA
jgi:hypothetical protein